MVKLASSVSEYTAQLGVTHGESAAVMKTNIFVTVTGAVTIGSEMATVINPSPSPLWPAAAEPRQVAPSLVTQPRTPAPGDAETYGTSDTSTGVFDANRPPLGGIAIGCPSQFAAETVTDAVADWLPNRIVTVSVPEGGAV